jgi:uncharacterized protein with FMN-binding domain
MVRLDDYSLRVESVRENRIEAVRIRDHSSERREREASQAAEGAEEPDGESG